MLQADFNGVANCDTFSVAPSTITANLNNVLTLQLNHLALRFVVNKLCLISKNALKKIFWEQFDELSSVRHLSIFYQSLQKSVKKMIFMPSPPQKKNW